MVVHIAVRALRSTQANPENDVLMPALVVTMLPSTTNASSHHVALNEYVT